MEVVDHEKDRVIDRELSWLSFNERVLQEAEDGTVPLFERLKFLAIFSSNLDEFFRVRVAALRTLVLLKKKKVRKLPIKPAKLVDRIHRVVHLQQERFGAVFRNEILPALEQLGIRLIRENELIGGQNDHLRAFFDEHVRPVVEPAILGTGPSPFLKDHTVYLVAELWQGRGVLVGTELPTLAVVEVPSPPLPRFVSLPEEEGGRCVMFLDDVIRYCLPSLFPDHEVGNAYAVKVSRDAGLHLDEEFSGSLREAIAKSLKKRDSGMPIRFLYDQSAPHAMVRALKEFLGLAEEDLFPGGRYHNLHDLWSFPVEGGPEHSYPVMEPLAHPSLDGVASLFEAAGAKDRLLHFPYQSYEYVVDFLRQASEDPAVEEIWISLYRVADGSAIVNALIEAARGGKSVSAFVEVQARFDERANLECAERMEEAGIRTLYGSFGIKVHAKLALVRRREAGGHRLYAYLATGNFNEKTAGIYCDHALMTADPRLTEEVHRIFQILAAEADPSVAFEHLLVAPFHLREGLERLIDAEIEAAEAGRPSGIVAKMNSLEDESIIRHLYRASRAGVPIRLIVRGICCLVPGVNGMSGTISARSVVDRFLEHSRILLFHHGGEDRIYLASADWMGRNLDRRIEVAFPIYDDDVRQELMHVVHVQLADGQKARIIEGSLENRYARNSDDPPVRCQIDTYRYLKGLLQGGGGESSTLDYTSIPIASNC